MAIYVIAGAGSGIGKATAIKLAAEGHTVYALGRSEAKLAGMKVYFIPFDAQTAFAGSLPDTIDGLAYCPGTINLKPFARISEQDLLTDLQINVFGAVNLIQKCLPALRASGKGSVVLFSTVAVQTGMPFHSSVAIAKGAIEGLTRSLAAELAPAIRVNAIAPSLTATPLAERLLSSPEKTEVSAKRHPLNKIGQPEDLANAACYLLTEQSAWVTGQILAVDGGMSSIRLL